MKAAIIVSIVFISRFLKPPLHLSIRWRPSSGRWESEKDRHIKGRLSNCFCSQVIHNRWGWEEEMKYLVHLLLVNSSAACAIIWHQRNYLLNVLCLAHCNSRLQVWHWFSLGWPIGSQISSFTFLSFCFLISKMRVWTFMIPKVFPVMRF